MTPDIVLLHPLARDTLLWMSGYAKVWCSYDVPRYPQLIHLREAGLVDVIPNSGGYAGCEWRITAAGKEWLA